MRFFYNAVKKIKNLYQKIHLSKRILEFIYNYLDFVTLRTC